MPRNQQIGMYIILGLSAIGILSVVAHNPGGLLIPLLIFGAVFYFYKFPPNRRHARPASTAKHKEHRHTRKAVFRVIKGNKTGDDDKPRYH